MEDQQLEFMFKHLFICKMYLYSYLCKLGLSYVLTIGMCAHQGHSQYDCNHLKRIMTLHGFQAIWVHCIPSETL